MFATIFFRYLRNICGATFAIYALGGLLAQPTFAEPDDAVDPVGRVGRIAWIEGTVRLSNPQTGESFEVPVNQPLTSGDLLRAERGARAEIQIGSAIIRLDGDSELELAQIDDEHIRLQLNDGRIVARFPSRETLADFELTTRDGRFSPRETGVYRFDTDSRSTVATVYDGNLQAESGRNMVVVEPGQGAQFWDVGDTGQSSGHRILAAVDDDFTRWSADRDQQSYATVSSPRYADYVSPEMTGAADLDRYGDWSETNEYGAVWLPRRVSPDWAPYRNGHWAWVDPWGWNWVGEEPWGFAPFHYGRWVRYRGVWAWVPGTRVVRPVYSPAMVAWVGSSGVGVSFSFGSRPGPNVGWLPLAPREVYVPAFRSSPRYVVNVNRTHVTRIPNVTIIANDPGAVMRRGHYANRDFPQAVSRLPVNAWRGHERRAMPAFEARRRPGLEPVVPVVTAVPVSREVDRREMSRRQEDVRESGTRRFEVRAEAARRMEARAPAVMNAAPAAAAIILPPVYDRQRVRGANQSDSGDSREPRLRENPEARARRIDDAAVRMMPAPQAAEVAQPLQASQPLTGEHRVEGRAIDSSRGRQQNRSEESREVRRESRSAERRPPSESDGQGRVDEDWRKKRRPRSEP